MSDPPTDRPSPPRRPARLNFTLLQFILFAGAGAVGLVALLAAGLAFGLALAGAATIAVLVLAVWVMGANLAGGRRGRER
jgi:small-conductance mechanosensitive channel